jgi:hypothetical protein
MTIFIVQDNCVYMKGRTTIQKTNAITDQMISTSGNKEGNANGVINLDGISDMLIKECNTSFSNYLEWLGLSRDPKLVVLSSVHHYYYDAEEMKNVKTVVNLKELNYIKDISSFLHSMFLILPPKSFLLGCFADNKKQGIFSFRERKTMSGSDKEDEEIKNGIVSRVPILNTLFTFLDAKTFNYLSRSNVSLLLENNGFKVADMTELNGLTYFCSQNQRTTGN